MSKTTDAVKIFQAAENAIIAWHEKQGDQAYCATELANAIVEGWERMPTAKTPQAHCDNIYNAVIQVLEIKARLNPTHSLLPRDEEAIKWIARMTVKQVWD